MRKIIYILTFIISSVQVLACNYANDPALREQKAQCLANESRQWDCNLNRCIYTQEALDDRDEFKECDGIESVSERRKCQETLADKKVGKLPHEEAPHMLGASVAAANTLLVAINYFSKDQKGCTSRTILGVTGLVGIAQEVYFRVTTKNKFEEIQEKYEKDELYLDPYEGQRNAFKYLKEEQEHIESTAKQRKMAYYLLTAGYAAATGFAAYETFAGGDQCGPANDVGNDGSPEGEVAQSAPGKIMGFLGSSKGIMTLGAIGTATSLYLASAAAKEEEQAKKNADKIQTVLDRFEKSIASLCPAGRDDIRNAECYCYNSDGSKNDNRTNSGTCQQLWAGKDQYLYMETRDRTAAEAREQTGCVNLRGEFDADCNCRKFLDDRGQNSCQKVSVSTTIPSVGAGVGLGQFVDNANNSFSGDISGGDITGTANQRLATKAISGRDQLLRQIDSNLKKDKKAPTNFDQNKITKDFLKQHLPQLEKISKGKRPLLASISPKNPALQKALQKAKSEVKLKETDSYQGKGKGILKKASKRRNARFTFGEGSGGTKVQTFNGASDSQNENYDYKSNDIVTRDDVTIWKVLTHRYNTSGLKRLFNE